MDVIFGFPKEEQGNDGILVFVDRLSKMVHLAAVPETITAEGSARTRCSVSMASLVTWSLIEIDASRPSFGKLCFAIYHSFPCIGLTTPRWMGKRNSPTVFCWRFRADTPTRS